jgi:hypothetical protein
VRYEIDAPLFGLGNGVLHGRLFEKAVLDEALRKAAECHATGAANGRYCVVIHGLKVNPTP